MLTDTISVGVNSNLLNKRIVNQFMKSFFQSKTPAALKESFEDHFPSYRIVIDKEKVSLKHQKDKDTSSESAVAAQTQAPECSDKEKKHNG